MMSDSIYHSSFIAIAKDLFLIVSVLSDQSDLSIESDQVISLVSCVLENEGCRCDEIAIHFVSEEKITELHTIFFDDPTPTDCITFPIDQEEDEEGYRLLGEVFVSPAAALSYTKESGADSYEELSLYIIHGLLHLLGYDDQSSAERKKMKDAEKRLMKMSSEKGLLLQKAIKKDIVRLS